MKVFALVSSLAPLAGQASAHGYLSQPAATFKDGVADTNCSAILAPDIDPAFRGSDWNGSPIDNAADFADAFPNTSFGSLRDMIDSVMIDCGNTALTNQRVDVGSLHSMKWQDDDTHRGFTDSHHVRIASSERRVCLLTHVIFTLGRRSEGAVRGVDRR